MQDASPEIYLVRNRSHREPDSYGANRLTMKTLSFTLDVNDVMLVNEEAMLLN